jgi:hypothetical protein
MGLSQQQLNRFFEIINASKLPSELDEATVIDSVSTHLVIQDGTADAEKVKVRLLRGDLGDWNANTNTPALIDGTGIGGDYYYVTDDGTQDLGSGVNSYLVGDVIQYFSGVWRLRPSTKGTSQTTNYSSILPPQLFNPDSTAVTANTDDYILSLSNDVAFVTINGKVLDDAEYSLSASTLTVTPVNGFDATDDEVLVFQHTFASIGFGGVFGNYTIISTDYTMLDSDYDIECTSALVLDFITALGNKGKEIRVKNSSASDLVTLGSFGSETLEGELTQGLEAGASHTYISNGTNWLIY